MQQIITLISIKNSQLAHTNYIEHLDLQVLLAVLPSCSISLVTPGPFAIVVMNTKETVNNNKRIDIEDYNPPIE